MPPKELTNLTVYKRGHLVGHPDVIPIEHIINTIVKLRKMEPNKRLLFINASTGSGKTTVIPPEVYLSTAIRSQGMPNIGLIMPRVITTKSVFTRIMETFPVIKTPRDITYNVGSIKLGSSPLTIMTTGIFIRTLQSICNKTDLLAIKRYNIIIVDESHKKTLDMNMMFSFVKTIINSPDINNADKPLFIFMSATLEISDFVKYFDIVDQTDHALMITGTTSSRTDIFIDVPYPTLLDGIYSEILNIIGRFNVLPKGDILVFLPTTKDISTIKLKLTKWILEKEIPLLPIQLTGSDVNNFTDNVLYKDLPVHRIERFGKKINKIYLATNVAEEGLTLPKLRYVIDSGYSKSIEYNPHYMAECTIIKPISKSSAHQRWGRTGRDEDGIAYSLYSKAVFDKLIDQDLPEIIMRDFSMDYLTLKNANIDPSTMMSAPTSELLHVIEDKLYYLGCIDGDNKITEVGEIIRHLNSVSVESAKMIMSGYAYNICVADLITIAAAIENITAKTNTEMADQFISAACRLELYLFGHNPLSDKYVENVEYITTVNNGKLEQFINDDIIISTFDLRQRILKNFAEVGLSIYNVKSRLTDLRDLELGNTMLTPDLFELLASYKKCIYEGYKNNLIIKKSCTQNSPKFVDIRGHPINVGELYTSLTTVTNNALGITNCEYPTYSVAHKLEIRKNASGSYELFATKLSIMDGFVGVDTHFMSTHTFNIPTTTLLPANKLALYEALLPKGKHISSMSIVPDSDVSIATAIAKEMDKQNNAKPANRKLDMMDSDVVILSKTT